MDAVNFERDYDGFQQFQTFFAQAFGRKQWRERSRNYLQALLVQAGERRNAENLSETVPASARVMQRFLTESPGDDDTVIGRFQEYLGPRLAHPDAVWVLDGSAFPKQVRKSVEVTHQYCGRLGKAASYQARMFLAYVSPLGRVLTDKRLYLPESWISKKKSACDGVCAEGTGGLPVEDGVSPRILAGKPLAGFRATPSRRITVLYSMVMYINRVKNPLLHQ